MHRRDVTSTIWRTVVFSGAMLSASACHKTKPPANPTTTPPTDTTAKPADPPKGDGGSAAADPDEGGDARPRAGDDRPVGRGFILS